MRIAHVYVDPKTGWTLCGVRRIVGWGGVMLPASRFMVDNSVEFGKFLMCEKCKNHPDLGLLLLGQLP